MSSLFFFFMVHVHLCMHKLEKDRERRKKDILFKKFQSSQSDESWSYFLVEAWFNTDENIEDEQSWRTYPISYQDLL